MVAGTSVEAGTPGGHRAAGGLRSRWARASAVTRVALVVGSALVAAVAVHVIGVRIGPGSKNTVDLAVYRDAGRWVLDGYSPYAARFGRHLGYPLPFTYPPFAALASVPLALVPTLPLAWMWDVVLVGVLAMVVLPFFRPLAQRVGPWAPLAYAVVLVLVLWSRPVQDNLGDGQIDILLMAACMADLLVERPRWPRGMLIGLAAAIQVAPAIFAVYLLVSRRWRSFWVALSTAAAATAVAAIVMPGPSVRFFTKLLFQPNRVGNVAYFSNQSLWGIMARATLGFWHGPLLVVAVAAVAVAGLAAAAYVDGRDLARAVVIVGLVWTMVSPVTWIHGDVWILPALGLVVADGRSWWRVTVALVGLAALELQVPNLDHHPGLVHLPGALAAALTDAYGLVALVLLAVLAAGPLSRLVAGWRRPVVPGTRPTRSAPAQIV
ncbi:MAG: glycosyltransferase 87 family protein [Acidimicrobiales bacterium]